MTKETKHSRISFRPTDDFKQSQIMLDGHPIGPLVSEFSHPKAIGRWFNAAMPDLEDYLGKLLFRGKLEKKTSHH